MRRTALHEDANRVPGGHARWSEFHGVPFTGSCADRRLLARKCRRRRRRRGAMPTTLGPTTERISRAPVTMDERLAGTSASCSALRSDAEQQDAGDDAEQAAAAAEDGDPAQQDGRDDRELQAVAVVAAGAGVAQRPEDAGEGGHHAGDDEEPELGPRDRMPAKRAASALLPMAIQRRGRTAVACRTTPKITARTATMMMTHGMREAADRPAGRGWSS